MKKGKKSLLKELFDYFSELSLFVHLDPDPFSKLGYGSGSINSVSPDPIPIQI
jgi:hypothetical protein